MSAIGVSFFDGFGPRSEIALELTTRLQGVLVGPTLATTGDEPTAVVFVGTEPAEQVQQLHAVARERRIRTVLVAFWHEPKPSLEFDFYVATTVEAYRKTLKAIPDNQKAYLPWPADTRRISPPARPGDPNGVRSGPARKFLHVAGWDAAGQGTGPAIRAFARARELLWDSGRASLLDARALEAAASNLTDGQEIQEKLRAAATVRALGESRRMASEKLELVVRSFKPLEELEPSLQELVTETRGVRVLHDPSPRFDSWYCEGDAFLYPSRGDSWPRYAVEALAAGLPTFVSDCPSAADYFANFQRDHTEFARPRFLVTARKTTKIAIGSEQTWLYDVDEEDLARAIVWAATEDMGAASAYCRGVAQNLSWDRLLPNWRQVVTGEEPDPEA